MEIGGYFGLEASVGREYYPNLIALNSARNALVYLCKAKKIEKLYLPYFLCDSILEICKRENILYEFYHIDERMNPIFNLKLNKGEYIYIINYYGHLSDEEIYRYYKKYKSVIFDYAQAFFQRPVYGLDTIYSCRKYFGVPDGAYLSTKDRILEKLERDISMDRMKHILGRYEGGGKQYYLDYKKNNEKFKTLPLMYMSKLTHNLLKMIDYDMVKRKREKNYLYLQNNLHKYSRFEFEMPPGPYVYPLYIKGGMKVKKELAEKEIYVATLWPNVLGIENNLEKDFTENILPLPCDQRYGIEEMAKICNELLLYL